MFGLRRTGLVLATAALLPATISPATADSRHGHGVPLDRLTVVTTEVAAGLTRPVAMVAATDRSGRVLIISDRVNSVANERGLLGIVPAPDFRRTGDVFVAYSRLPDGALTLSRVPLGH